MSNCKIILQDNCDIFESGSEINGILQCEFAEINAVNCIKVQLIGKEFTTVYIFYTNRTKYGVNTFLTQEIILLSPIKGVEKFRPGIYSFKFTLKLPQNLPSSLRTKHGKVAYICRALIVRPILKSNFEDTIRINIKTPITFINIPRIYYETINLTKERRYVNISSCRNANKIILDIKLPKKVFSVGEIIDYEAKITNNSCRVVGKFTAKLIEVINVTAKHTRKSLIKKSVILKETHDGRVLSRSCKSIQGELKIPENLDVFNVEDLKFISICHVMVFKCCVKASRGVEVKVKFVLGHGKL